MIELLLSWVTDHIEEVKLTKQGCETTSFIFKGNQKIGRKDAKQKGTNGREPCASEVLVLIFRGFACVACYLMTCNGFLSRDRNSKSQRKLHWNSVNPATSGPTRRYL